MTNDALKPCPFCGGEKILIYKKFFKVDCPDAEMETHKKVKCDGCGIGTEWYYDTRFGTAEENARNAWNTRHPTQKNGCCDIDPDRCAGMCELPAIIKAALAPVDVEGLRTKAKNIRACFELLGNRCDCTTIEGALEYGRAQGLEMAADHLAAQGHLNAGWQPIETAPKDGTWIMVYWPTMGIGQYPFVVFWDEGWQPARYSDRDYGEAFPTHWMPLPAAPKKEE